jgi:hypothetical protein
LLDSFEFEGQNMKLSFEFINARFENIVSRERRVRDELAHGEPSQFGDARTLGVAVLAELFVFARGQAKAYHFTASFDWHGLSAFRRRALDAADPVAFDFGCDRTLEQSYRHDNAPAVFYFDYNAFESGKRTVFNADAVALAEVGPRLGIEFRLEEGFNCGDLFVRDRQRLFSDANNGNYPGSGENGEPLQDVEAAKNVAREKRSLNFSYTVAPAAPITITGKIRYVAL